MPEIGNRAPVLYGLFLVGQDKLPFGKLAVRHGLQLVHRCGGKLAHILVHCNKVSALRMTDGAII